MTRTLSIYALVLVTLLGAMAGTADAARSRGRTRSVNGTFSGAITRLARTQMSFKAGGGKTYTVNYDQRTSVTGGSKKGTLDDLAVGQKVKVTVKNNRAAKIDVSVR